MTRRAVDPTTIAPLGWFVRVGWVGPAVLAAVFIAAGGGVIWLMHDRELETRRDDLVRSAEAGRESIRRHLNAGRDYLRMLGRDLAGGLLSHEEFNDRVAQYAADHPALVSVMYVDSGTVVRWRAPREPGKVDEPHQLTIPEIREACQRARRERRAAYSTSFVTMRGEAVIAGCLPVFDGEKFLGALVGAYSCELMLRQMLQREIIQHHQAALLGDGGHTIIHLPTVARVDERLVISTPLDPPGGGISLRLARYGGGFWGVALTLLTLLCVGLVVGMAWGMWLLNTHIARRARTMESLRKTRDELTQRVSERTRDLEHANRRLQKEMRDRQQAEQQARQRLEELAHVARVTTMGEMAAGLAHELNQPLGAIASFAGGAVRLVDAGQFDPDELRLAMGEISEQARRAGRIIHRLRTFVATGRPQRAPNDLRGLVTEVVDLLAMDIRHEQIDLELDLPEDLPPVLADGIQVQQVVLNLMHNAIEAMRAVDPAERRLTVRARPDDGSALRVTVSDAGAGCSDETLSMIFDAFYTTKESGLGMGLSISRSIVEAHGGKLWTTRNAERGLSLQFTLPTAEEEADDQEPTC